MSTTKTLPITRVRIDGPTRPVVKHENVIILPNDSPQARVQRVYIETEEALRSQEFRSQILLQAKADAKLWADKYRHLKELARVIQAVDGLQLNRSARP